MTMRIAILAACASTLVLAQADLAQAGYGAASQLGSPAITTGIGPDPAIVLAQSRPWMHQQPGMGGARFDPGSRRVDDPSGTMLDVATTRGKLQPAADGNKGNKRAGQRDAWDHNWKTNKVRNGLPERGRKLHPGKTGKAAIFDRGQEIPMTSY